MNKYNFFIVMISAFMLVSVNDTYGQAWNFVKGKDGIKIYTRDVSGSSLKSFKGEVTFKADIEKVSLIVGNAKNIDWWDKDIIEKKVVAFEENKFIRYYIVYDVPWPFSRRDLVLEAQISTDPITGDRIVFAKPLLNLMPEKPEIVRIKKYWQKWTVQPMNNGNIHVILEGFVDPGGNIPNWLYNTVITETPFRVLTALRDRVLSDRPANK